MLRVEASEIDVSDENVVCYLIFSPTLLGINIHPRSDVMVVYAYDFLFVIFVMRMVFCPKTFVYIEVWRLEMMSLY